MVTTDTSTLVSWSFSADGGTAWQSITSNDEQAVTLAQTARSILLKASLSGTAAKTPYIESYSLILVGAANPLVVPGLRFTGKELDMGTGLDPCGGSDYSQVVRCTDASKHHQIPVGISDLHTMHPARDFNPGRRAMATTTKHCGRCAYSDPNRPRCERTCNSSAGYT